MCFANGQQYQGQWAVVLAQELYPRNSLVWATTITFGHCDPCWLLALPEHLLATCLHEAVLTSLNKQLDTLGALRQTCKRFLALLQVPTQYKLS